MSNQLSLPSVAGTSFIRADMQFRHPEIGIDSHTHTAEASSTTAQKRKRNLPGNPDPDAEVVALSPKTLMASKRFVCEVCNKGFQRDQNLQLHRRGHNLPWKLRQRTTKELKKRVYICPEPNCVHNNPARALGDLTGIKKHFCRKHGEKKWKCNRCAKRYAVQSDWKAHSKTCGTREYRCDCGTLFSRRDSFITHRAFCDALAEETVRASNGHNHNHNHNQHLLQYKSPLFSSSSGLSNATQLAFAMNMRLPPPPNYPHYLSPPSCSSAGGSASFNGQPPLSVQSIIAFANQKQKQELVEEPVIPVTKWPYHQDTTTTNTNTNTTNNNNRLLINHELIMPENSNMHPKLSPAAGVAARGFSQISQTSLNNFPNLFPSKAVYTALADESSEDCRNPRTMPGFINPSAVTFNSGDYHEGVQLFPEGGPLAVMFGSDGHVSTRSSASMQGQLMISDNVAAGQEICWPYNNNDRFQLSNSSTTAPTLNPMQMNSRTHATSLQSSYVYNEGSSAGIIAEASQMQDHTSSSDGFLTATPPPFGLSDIFNIKSSPKPPLLENNSVAAAYMGKTASSASLHEGIIHPMSNSLHSQLARNRRSLSHTADLPSNHYSLQSMMMNEDGWKKHGLANLALFQPPTSSSSSFSSSSSSPSIPNSIAHSDQKVLTRDFLGMGRHSHAISTLNPGRTRGATFTVSEFSNINTAAAAAAAASSSSAAAAATTAFLNHELASKTSHHYQHQYRHNH